MDDREKIRVEQEARDRVHEPQRTTAYGGAINRYLGALSYADLRTDRKPTAVPVRAEGR